MDYTFLKKCYKVKKNKLNVEFDNLTEAQAIALEDLFSMWMFLKDSGSLGRWTAFYIDKTFKSKVTINGRQPVSITERFIKNNSSDAWNFLAIKEKPNKKGELKIVRGRESFSGIYMLNPNEIKRALCAKKRRKRKLLIEKT